MGSTTIEWESQHTRDVFVCISCGTIAHTDSRKRIVEIDPDHNFEGLDPDVQMTPPCPCGNDLFNRVPNVEGGELK